MSVEQAGIESTETRRPVGTVAAVSRNETYEFSKPVRDEITLIAGVGVEGDAHAGVTVRHRSRVRADPTQPNLRQVHLMRGELFDEVRAKGYEVGPGQIGENITTTGIDLLNLPRGTILRFGTPAERAGETPAGTRETSPDAPETPAGTRETPPDARETPPDARETSPATRETWAGTRETPPDARVTRPADATLVPGAGGAARDIAEQANGPNRAAEAIAGLLGAAAAARLDEATARAMAALVTAADRVGDDPRPAVVVTGLRNPCAQIEGFRPGLLKQVLGRDAEGTVIRRAGVMGVVLRGGPVRRGDPIEIDPPPGPPRPLERV